ncbi:MAG: DUF4286 family protein [Bacteroidota bacterium]|nr:DUF4286 family protein [Bacteroidota bacterium]
MILYNVSIKIDIDIHDEWFDWMKEIHLPAVMGTGCFLDHKMYRLFVDESDGITYVVQYYCVDMPTLKHYQGEYGPGLRHETQRLFGDKQVSFRTTMELV